MIKQVLELILQKFKEDKLTMDEAILLIQSYNNHVIYPTTYTPYSSYVDSTPDEAKCTSTKDYLSKYSKGVH